MSFSRRVVRFRKVLKRPLKKTITALKRPKVESHLKSGKGTFKKMTENKCQLFEPPRKYFEKKN